MKRYIGNAFSLGMLDCAASNTIELTVMQVRLEVARLMYGEGTEYESCVGHADTALLLSEMLGSPVDMRRVTTSLAVGDELLIAQYTGPRLPQGATSLPEGAKIRWFYVRVAQSASYSTESIR